MAVPQFIADLRKHIGHDPLWLVGSTAVVIRPGADSAAADGSDGTAAPDRVLFVRRSDNGEWAPVTGICDPGEHPAVTAVRETLEETHVEATVDRLVMVSVSPFKVLPNRDQAQFCELTFRLTWQAGEGEVGDDESTDVVWFPVDALPPMPDYLEARVLAAIDDKPECRLVVDGIDLPLTPPRGAS